MCPWYFEIRDYWSIWPLLFLYISICMHCVCTEVLWVASAETKFAGCTCSTLPRQTSQEMVIFGSGQSGFSRPSDQGCSLAVMENESILLQICHVVHLLVPLCLLYLCGERSTIFIHVYFSDYEYVPSTVTYELWEKNVIALSCKNLIIILVMFEAMAFKSKTTVWCKTKAACKY